MITRWLSQEEFEAVLKEITEKLLEEMMVKGWWRNGLYTFDVPEPKDINCGNCEDWAMLVVNKVHDVEAIWLDEYRDEFSELMHCVVRWNKRFYDSECHKGVDNIIDLPYCQRNLKLIRS